MRRFESSRPSQAVLAAERLMQRVQEAFPSKEGEGEPIYIVIGDREMKI
jgi:hypothetical protein